MDDGVYQTVLKGSNFVKNILFLIEKNLREKCVCLFVRTVIKTFLLENIKIVIFVLVRDTSIVFSLFIIYLLSFFLLFTHDIILISTDHFFLWLSLIVLHSLLYIYARPSPTPWSACSVCAFPLE